MSFFTALTGLQGATADISAISNNIANVGTTGFKRSVAEFGDIFATSPLQNSASSIGSGAILKGVKQQFTQGNIASSLNALDLAISGQGFFALKPSLTSNQVAYTRNGSFVVDNNRNVVDSTGQFLLTYQVNEDGSVTSKSIDDALPLQLPATSGTPQATSNISLSVNTPSDSPVIKDQAKFADGYTFSPNDPDSFTNSTSLTIFDDLGNPTIATVFFIKTKASTADDVTNKYDTKLVIDGTIIEPDLVEAVNDNGDQIFIDKFGNQTTLSQIPDDNFFVEGKGSPLYRSDNQSDKVPSEPARLTGEQSTFDFGEEGNKLIEITNDPMRFLSTREGGNNGSIFWGKDFLLVNADDGDVPVSVDIRAGFYNAAQLATEVERSINQAYGDDKKLQIRANVDDELTIDLFDLDALDGTLNPLSLPITVDLLADSFVTQQQGITVVGASSPDFTLEEYLAHTQVRINDAMSDYVITPPTGADNLGVGNNLFARTTGTAMTSTFQASEIVSFDYHSSASGSDPTGGSGTAATKSTKFLSYSFVNKTPTLDIYTTKTDVASTKTIKYAATDNALTIDIPSTAMGNFSVNDTIRLSGDFTSNNALLDGREFQIFAKDTTANTISLSTSGLGFPSANFTLTNGTNFTNASVLSGKDTSIEAFFEGAALKPEGAVNSYNSKKIILRESPTLGHSYDHDDIRDGSGAAKTIFSNFAGLTMNTASSAAGLTALGLTTVTHETTWVDELNPPVKIAYDAENQRFEFTVNHTAIGPGSSADFRAFKVSGATSATATNNLGIPNGDAVQQVAISSTAKLSGEPFVADGSEIFINAKRFGVKVAYNSDTKNFTFASGSTGEAIDANSALGVSSAQSASNIQVGRLLISAADGTVQNATFDTSTVSLGLGENALMGVGASKTAVTFEAGTGKASVAAEAVGAPATEPLSEIFNLSAAGNANIFNVSVNGISNIITVPPGNYVGSTLAEELQTRINQMQDPVTGAVVGGVSVQFASATNNFVFTTGTSGTESTIKVKGAAKLGLDDVALGIGSVPTIINLQQATNAAGVPLYVNSQGAVVETPPANLVDDYFPLFIDEGELTFDKTGQIVSPKNKVHYEEQGSGFSISLDVDYSASTQLAQPFSVNNLVQDGFTSGNLDGLDIDATGLLRANYTNGDNIPLGKIVMANFNNQNGLKQIGNATFVETASSGSAIFGEANAEGFGSVQSGSLERANVDITEELVNLITAQRNFQASSKAIETSTQLTQTIINIRA